MRFVISKEAKIDLENIWLYTFENWSQAQADRYVNLIFEEIELISEEPLAAIDYSHVRKGYYKTRVKSHFIFYRMNEKLEEIEVIRILHQQMDIDSHLTE
jgi:toxin ParE1/3/4